MGPAESQSSLLASSYWLWLAVLLVPSSSSDCGGHLTERRGLLSTPGFPGRFAVPIHCRWVVDASELSAERNASIVVYLSQLYVFRGLSFTEYAYYESETVSFGGSLVRTIDEGNVFDYRWLRTFRPYLVVEFELDRLEGNHVRVLDKLLDVYGFNITYEVTEDGEKPGSCSLRDCSYAGNCLLASDYTTFYCDCFEGFGGEHCGHGPLCVTDRGNPICQNGGTCRHVGAAAVRCLCAPGFSGDFCEISTKRDEESECPDGECIFQCPFPGDCHCKQPSRVRADRARFEGRIKLSNASQSHRAVDRSNASLEARLAKQLAKYIWESKITSTEGLKILSVTPALEVNFHFFGDSRDGDKLRSILNRLVQHRRLGELSLEPSHFTFQQKPALRLQTLRINQANERRVHLGDEFILTCLAVGSSDLKFSWYKDDMLVNMSKATREIWYRQLPNDGSDYHTSILGVEKATLLDEGEYTCQVSDWGVQQCRHIRVTVRDEPNVKVVPMSSTVEKGSTLRLMCTTPNMRSIGIGFGWTKNRALLRLEPGQEVWEDLYPAGSLLTISRASTSATYACNVAHRSASVRVDVVNRSLVPVCLAERDAGLDWPDAAPGSRALLPCPHGFAGPHVSRQCSMRSQHESAWSLPDFSGCLYEPLLQAYDAFRSLTLGYQSTNGSSTIQALWDALQYRRSSLYPGEGDRIISMLQEVENYQYNIDELNDLKNSAEAMMRIIDKILSHDHSVLSQQKLVLLSQLVLRNLGYWSQDNSENQKHLSLSEVVVDVLPMKVYSSSTTMYSLKIPQDNQNKYPNWYNERVTIRLYHNRLHYTNKSISGIVVVYRNLAQFFPDAYVTELEDGTDLEYRLSSRVVSVATSYKLSERGERLAIELELAGPRNGTTGRTWNASCGALGPDGDWRLDGCSLADPGDAGDATLHCLCANPGTFAAFLTTRGQTVVLVKNAETDLAVMMGCGSCSLLCLLSALVLAAFWWRNHSWLNFLKIQCCVALIAAMATFIYAVHYDVSENNLSIVAMSLEAFLLIGTSSPISQALIIYTELANIHPSQQFQPTVVAVITGVPILAILMTELTRKTIGWKHESWWLIIGTRVYNIFVICSITLLLTFLLLYIAIIHKTRPLLYKFTKKDMIQLRVRMLHRSAIVIFGIVAVEISSILYVNSTSIVYHYLFAFFSALLGLIILVMYVISGEVLMVSPVLHKLKRQTNSDDECASEPTKGSKEAELERELSSSSGATQLPAGTTLLLTAACEPVAALYEPRGVAAGIDVREYVNEAAAGAYARHQHHHHHHHHHHRLHHRAPEIQIHHVDDGHLEPATQTYCPAATTNFACVEPRIGVNPYKELVSLTALHQPVGVQPSLVCAAQVETCLDGIGCAMPDITINSGGEVELLKKPQLPAAITVTTTTAAAAAAAAMQAGPKEPRMPDIANTMERKQPDGEDVLVNARLLEHIAEEPEPLTANGMLDRISHDLDYLLNRTKQDG